MRGVQGTTTDPNQSVEFGREPGKGAWSGGPATRKVRQEVSE